MVLELEVREVDDLLNLSYPETTLGDNSISLTFFFLGLEQHKTLTWTLYHARLRPGETNCGNIKIRTEIVLSFP